MACTLIPSSGVARPLAEAPGWGGELAVTGVFIRKQSQFDTDDDNQVTADLDNSGQQTESGLPLPLGRLDYTLEGLKTQYFLGNSRDNVSKGQIAIEFGVTHQFDDSSQLTAAYFPRLPISGETWKDPYLQLQPRVETMERAQGGRLTWENIAGTLLIAEYAFAVNRIDEEASGSSLAFLDDAERALLNRDAFLQRVSIDSRLPLAPGVMLKPGVFYTLADAAGEANSFDQYGLRLQSIYRKDRHFLTATLTYSRLSGTVTNPVFGTRQADDSMSLFALYSYAEPFGWKNWNLLGIGFWQQNDSTINFYDSDTLGLGVGLGYRWR